MNTQLLIPLALALASNALAAPVYNPANGHYYDSVATTTANWTDAKRAAESLTYLGAQGHMATITSQDEQNFIVANLPGVTVGYFLGGYQENNIDWLWVTGEPFVYSNWSFGEPNNFQGNAEDFLQFHGYLPDGNPSGLWNDVGNFPSTGFVVEFEPITGIAEGQTAERNGHIYTVLYDPDGSGVTATEAEAYAVSKGCHLVTINDFAENSWIAANFAGYNYLWIGLNDIRQEGAYEWLSGERSSFRFWYLGEPNNSNGTEDNVIMYNLAALFYQWNDFPGGNSINGIFPIYALMECDPGGGAAEVNQPPTITVIPDQIVGQGSSTAVGFTVGDAPGETPSANLIVTASSSNEELLPPSGIIVGGSGQLRSIKLTTKPTKIGMTMLTVTVTDTGTSSGADVKSANRTFLLTVKQVQEDPEVSVIPDITTEVNKKSETVKFTVSDQETPSRNLVVSAIASSNPTLIPLQNVQFGGGAGNRHFNLDPAQDRAGKSTVTIRVTDADKPTLHFTDRSFNVTVESPNKTPKITGIADITIDQNSSTGPLAFQVADVETAAGLLAVTGSSTIQALVPNANILLPFPPGTRGDRTVIVIPAVGVSGTAVITLTVKDSGSPPGTLGNEKTATTLFTVTVRPVGPGNTPPTILPKPIADVIVEKNSPTPVIPFTVDDLETAKGFLIVTAQSSNPTLIPVGNIFFGGRAGNRTVFITPAFDQIGTATITLTVTDDGGLTDNSSFKVTVTEPPPPLPWGPDLDGDGLPDILLQTADGSLAHWSMDGENVATAGLLSPNNSGDPGSRLVSSGNFNGDSKPDLLFQHTSGDLVVWYMNGVSLTSSTLLNPSSPGAGWSAIGTGDFNGDGKSDILLQHTDRTLKVLYMNGTDVTSPAFLSPSNPGAEWAAVAVADLNSDGNPDIVFEDNLSTLAVWYMNGVDLNSVILLNPASSGAGWVVKSSTDLDGDGNPDLVFQNASDGRLAAWFLNGVDLIRATLLNPASPGGTWQVVGP